MPRILTTNEMNPVQFQPKVRNRFVLMIDGIQAFTLKTCKFPSVSTTTQKIDHINTYFKYQGKAEWDDISFTTYDPINPSTAQQIIEWFRQGYETLTGRAGYPDFYKKDIKIQILGPVGDVVSEWSIFGAFIQNADFGEGDWSDDGSPIEISVTLSYDRAILEY